MAELAIPLIALGSMYIISNQDKQKQKVGKENLTNMAASMADSFGGNAEIAYNYPIETNVMDDNIKEYKNPNQVTDKYFAPSNNNVPENNLNMGNGNVPQFISLTGMPLERDDMKHNNMTPYFGAKLRGATVNANISEGLLDNMQGGGSQQFRKTAVAPLFKPQDNMQWANGAPNQSDFIQSRMNTSLRMANTKPWEEQRVAPGLNQGYNTNASSSGLNSGMDARETWQPKSVDELRIKTNPKLSFDLNGHQGPANSTIKSRGNMGVMEKHLPDTYYNNTPDRWFTTTGLEKAQTARSTEVLHDVTRTNTTQEYYGATRSATGEAGYTPQYYHPSFRTETAQTNMAPPTFSGKTPASSGDYGRQGYSTLHNNRTTTKNADIGYISGAMKSVMAPLFDVLKPSRKENVVNNLRPYEGVSGVVPASTVFNPADRTKTTNRETQDGLLDNTHLNVERQVNNAYLVSEQQSIENNRDTTWTSVIGSSGGMGAQTGPRPYDADYNQRNNTNKTYPNRPNQGGTQIFNQYDNIKVDRHDGDRNNNRMWVRSVGNSVPSAIPSTDTIGKYNIPQTYNQGIAVDRMQPDILTAFKQNPYTHSLQSWA
jgi:hypothetical protein